MTGAYTRILEATLDLGNVWQDEDATTGVTLHNTSPWTSAHWHLQALPMRAASRRSESLPGINLLDLDGEANDAWEGPPQEEELGQAADAAASDQLEWLQLAATSGTLAPGAHTTVQVRCNEVASPS